MADESDPVADLVHDLRSPLAVIELYSGVLAQGGDDLTGERQAEYVARIRRAVADLRERLDQASTG